jgi:hypothetical protein
MKKTTVNLITNIIGFVILLSIVPVSIIVQENVGIIIAGLGVVAFVAIYFKNADAQALVSNFLKGFKT